MANSLVSLLDKNIVGHLTSSLVAVHPIHVGARGPNNSRGPPLKCFHQPFTGQSLFFQYAEKDLAFPKGRNALPPETTRFCWSSLRHCLVRGAHHGALQLGLDALLPIRAQVLSRPARDQLRTGSWWPPRAPVAHYIHSTMMKSGIFGAKTRAR